MSQGGANFTILDNVVEIGGSSVSAFGTLETAEMTPLVQLDFIYGINTQTGVTAVANSATVDTLAGRLRLQSGTNSAGAATFTSRKTAKYRPGQGVTARFTGVWVTSAANSVQIVGAGSSVDGYFFGYNGTAFGVLLKNGGSSNWIAQTVWNGDKCDGSGKSGFTWNKTNGNVMMVKYPFLGYGDIKFYVQNPTTGGWILVHTIQYANSSPSVQVSNPNLSFFANITNGGNTTALTMYVGSVGIFLSGTRTFVGSPKWAYDNNKSGVTAETNIFTLQNCASYNGVTNQSLMRITHVSFSTTANNALGILRIRLGATVGGAPSFAPISGTGTTTITNGNSVASVDTAGTTATDGTLMFTGTTGPNGAVDIDLTPFDIFLVPGEKMTFSVFSSASNTVAVCANWIEDI